MEQIISLIPTIGFPAVCLIACGIFIYRFWIREQEQQDKREQIMFEQMSKFSNTLERFNETLTKIDTRLEIVENKLQ